MGHRGGVRRGALAATPPRALLIQASGRAVSAGVDVHEFDGPTPSMGGPQRLAERAGPARARQLVYTGALFDAPTLECSGVVTQVLPDEGFADAARAVALRLASGPTLAHAATKRLIRTAADAVVPGVSAPLFGTSDLRDAVASFLTDGPGKATCEGR